MNLCEDIYQQTSHVVIMSQLSRDGMQYEECSVSI